MFGQESDWILCLQSSRIHMRDTEFKTCEKVVLNLTPQWVLWFSLMDCLKTLHDFKKVTCKISFLPVDLHKEHFVRKYLGNKYYVNSCVTEVSFIMFFPFCVYVY